MPCHWVVTWQHIPFFALGFLMWYGSVQVHQHYFNIWRNLKTDLLIIEKGILLWWSATLLLSIETGLRGSVGFSYLTQTAAPLKSQTRDVWLIMLFKNATVDSKSLSTDSYLYVTTHINIVPKWHKSLWQWHSQTTHNKTLVLRNRTATATRLPRKNEGENKFSP